MNSVRHGLTALTVVLPGEDPEKFNELLDDYLGEYAPATKLEIDLVHELAAIRWRTMRAWVLDSTLLHIAACRNEKAANAEFETPPPAIRTAFGFMDLAENGKSFALLNRYETRLSRRFHQIIGELDRLQEKRKAEARAGAEAARALQQKERAAEAASAAEVTESKDDPSNYRVLITLPKKIVRNELDQLRKNDRNAVEKRPPQEDAA